MNSNSLTIINYDTEETMAKRLIYDIAILRLDAGAEIVTASAPRITLESLNADKISEIRAFARSYSSEILVTGDDKELLFVCATTFPSSSLCVVIRPDIPPADLLRLVQGYGAGVFVISRHLKLSPSRMCERVKAFADAFESLCKDIESCLLGVRVLDSCRGQVAVDKCLEISQFLGCPIRLEVEEGFEEAMLENADLPLLTAYVLHMLIYIRRYAPTRSGRIVLGAMYASIVATVYFESDVMMCISEEFLEWRHIALERDMHFYLFDGEEKGTHEMRFHVRRLDVGLLGLKTGTLVLRQGTESSLPTWMRE